MNKTLQSCALFHLPQLWIILFKTYFVSKGGTFLGAKKE
jgi:hypothetical protein